MAMVNVSSKYEASDTGRSVARDSNKRAEGEKEHRARQMGGRSLGPQGRHGS